MGLSGLLRRWHCCLLLPPEVSHTLTHLVIPARDAVLPLHWSLYSTYVFYVTISPTSIYPFIEQNLSNSAVAEVR